LTQSLVRIPSVAGEEGACQNFVSDRFKRLGFKVNVFEPNIAQLKSHPAYCDIERCEEEKLRSYEGRPNVVATIKGTGLGRSLILNGHADVVPPGPKEMWSHDPWGGEIEEGRVYGRGALDMKGGLAAMIAASEIISEADVPLKGDLILESVADEEPGGNGTLACLMQGYRANAAILTEPSQLIGRGAISLACRGANQFRIRVKGRSGHPSTSYMSADYVSAIDKASKLLAGIRDFNSIRQEEGLSLNHPLYRLYSETNMIGVGKIKGGEWFTIVPNMCLIEGTLECFPGEDLEETKKKFVNYVHRLADLDPWMRENPPEIEFFGLQFMPTEVRANEPIVTTLQSSLREVLNIEPKLFGLAGGSDQRIFTEYGKIPAVLYGPGGGGLHAADEFVFIEDVVDVTKVLLSVVSKWCT
jgi:acetylornithine deacetylase